MFLKLYFYLIIIINWYNYDSINFIKIKGAYIMIFKKRHIGGIVIMIGLIALTGMEVSRLTKSENHLEYTDEKDKVYEVKKNNDGQTYGSELSSKEYDDGPDLISVEMKNGETGYVYRDEFYDNANQPNNPKEAVEYTKTVEKNIKKYGYYKSIPVYKEDGKTEIGTFEIGGN